MREIRPEPRAEVDMPAPQVPKHGLGTAVVMRTEAAGGAGVLCVCHGLYVYCLEYAFHRFIEVFFAEREHMSKNTYRNLLDRSINKRNLTNAIHEVILYG